MTVVDVGLPETTNAVIARKATNAVPEPNPPAPVVKTYTKTDPEDVPDGFENDPYDDEVAKEVVVKY